MIWTLIFAGILTIGTVCAFVGDHKGYKGETLFAVGLIAAIVSGIASVFCIGFTIGVNVNAELDYQNKIHEQDMLEYRIEHMEDNITGNEMLYNDIVEFNNELRTIKKWANSPWTNWFNNQKIATMDYIEFGNTNEETK